MTREEIREMVVGAIRAVAPETRPAELAGDASLRDELDLDSVDFMNFVVALNDTLGVDVPEADYAHLATLDGCVEYLAQRI